MDILGALDEKDLDRIGAALAGLCAFSLAGWLLTASAWFFVAVLTIAGSGLTLEKLWSRRHGNRPA